jgi:hypothetical protein
VLQQRFVLVGSEEELLRNVTLAPDVFDAAVIFDGPTVSSWEQAGPEGAQEQQQQGRQGAGRAPPLLQYRLRLNHSDVPSTQFLYDQFDVSPGNTPVPGNSLWCAAGLAPAAVHTPLALLARSRRSQRPPPAGHA